MPHILGTMAKHIDNCELVTVWITVLRHLTCNPLGGAEVIKAGGAPIMIDILQGHAEHDVCLKETFRLLENLSSEPLYVEVLP